MRAGAKSGSGAQDLPALLPQLAPRADVPVERHRPDAEFAAQLGYRRVAVRHRGLGQPHLGFRQRELPAALPSASPRGLEPRHGAFATAFAPCPALEAATLAPIVPFGAVTEDRFVERLAAGGRGEPTRAIYPVIGSDYFRGLGLSVSGREFSIGEDPSAAGVPATVIDEPLARRLYPG